MRISHQSVNMEVIWNSSNSNVANGTLLISTLSPSLCTCHHLCSNSFQVKMPFWDSIWPLKRAHSHSISTKDRLSSLQSYTTCHNKELSSPSDYWTQTTASAVLPQPGMAVTLSLAEEVAVQQGGMKLPSFAVSDPKCGHNINAKWLLLFNYQEQSNAAHLLSP